MHTLDTYRVRITYSSGRVSYADGWNDLMVARLLDEWRKITPAPRPSPKVERVYDTTTA